MSDKTGKKPAGEVPEAGQLQATAAATSGGSATLTSHLQLSGTAAAISGGFATLTVTEWIEWAENHRRAAELFTERARELEAGGADEVEVHAYVFGAVVAAVAYLEATINALYVEATGATRAFRAPQFDAATGERLTQDWTAWRMELRLEPGTLDKYQCALKARRRRRFVENRDPYRDAWLVTKVRNYMIHFTPTHMTRGLVPHEKAEDWRHVEARFDACGVPQRNRFFPERVLSAGCAVWARGACAQFVDAFFERMNSTA